jgi:hypothetical protein
MHVLDLFNDKERKFLNGGPLEEAEVKTGMSRAAKGHEKYGKKGMQALAKAGREGASEKKLDAIRDQHNKYDESVAGPENCWPGHRKVGTKPGTGRNAGKRVNDCEKIKEDDVAEATGDVKFDKILKGITNKKQVAKQQKADTKQQARDAFGNMFGGGNPADKLGIRKKDVGEGMLDNPGEQDSPVAQAIVRRILLQRTDLLAKHGPDRVSAAVDEVADFVGDVDEIGSSDVSGWVRHVEQMLGNMQEGVAEGEYDSRKPFGVRYKVFAGREGRVTTKEYWTTSSEKLEKAVAKIEALGNFYEIDGYSYPKEKQGVAEVSDATLTSYLTKVDKDNLKHRMDPTKRSDAKRMKSGPNFVKAFTKLDNRKQGVAEVKKNDKNDDHEPFNYDEWKASTVKPRKPRGHKDAEALGAALDREQSELRKRKEQGVAEGSAENSKPRIRKYSKMRPDGSKSVRYEVLDYQGRRVSGQGTEGFDDPKNAKEFYYRNYDKLQAPVEEATIETGNNEQNSIETIGMKESSRYWCKDEKRWKDNK